MRKVPYAQAAYALEPYAQVCQAAFGETTFQLTSCFTVRGFCKRFGGITMKGAYTGLCERVGWRDGLSTKILFHEQKHLKPYAGSMRKVPDTQLCETTLR